MSEDSKRPIPREELTAYERWELPAMESGHIVSPGGRRSGRDENHEPRPLTAEEIEAIRAAAQEEGRAEGFAAGRSDGLAAARKEIDAQLARLRSLSESLLAPLEAEKEQVEETLTLLLTQLSRQVVARELSLDSTSLRSLVDEAIAALPAGSDRIRIAVSPADLQLFQDYEAELEQDCRFRADPALAQGGCRVETEFSLIDYSVDARFRTAFSAMVGQRFEQLEAMLSADLAEQQLQPQASADTTAVATDVQDTAAGTGDGAQDAASEAMPSGRPQPATADVEPRGHEDEQERT